jgi:hypothetical protein
MPRKPHYSIIDRILGRVPKTYTLNCLNASCDYHEHVLVSSSFEEEPYIEGHIGIRKLKKLPTRCPKCGCKNLRKSEGPPLHY